MAEERVFQMIKKNEENSNPEVHYPITKASCVFLDNGQDIQSCLINALSTIEILTKEIEELKNKS